MPLPLLAIAGTAGSILVILQLIFTVIAIVVFVVQVVAGFDITLSFLTDVKGPAASIVDTMYSYLTSFMPISINGIFSSLDNALSIGGNDNPFNPALTFSGFMSTIGFTQVFNSVVMCLLNSLVFVLNVRFLRWSINRLKLRFR